jgi:hypothetical protein
MVLLACLWSQCTKFHTAGWTCWFFMSYYLESCIWPDVTLGWIRSSVCITFCADLRKSVREILAVIRQACGEEIMSPTWKVQTHWDQIKGETSKERSQEEHSHHFLWHQCNCSRRIHPVWPNSRFPMLLWRFTATAWKCVKTLSRTLTTKELAVVSWLHTTSRFLFHQGMFGQKLHDWTPSQSTTCRILLKMVKVLGMVHTRGRGLLRWWWWSEGLKSGFDQNGSTSPRNYGWLFVYM